ncbi:MAG TPA: response regulator [Burkholderiaceae bacterium]|nr:response regulator [Burkholderiaceae bacterium]
MNPSADDTDPSGPIPAPTVRPAASNSPFRVCVIDADNDWRSLLEEWLRGLGCQVVDPATGCGSATTPEVDLVIVDLPFPRQGGVDLVKRITSRHPATPIVALSSNFFSRIECCGPVARDLGVDCVLPKPATREAIAAAVRRVLPV